MHLLPQLGKLEAEFPNELVVVGVHSAKFPGERPGGSLRHAVERNRVTHPVVNDRDFEIFQGFGARAWPTLMFIDPSGYVLGKHEGEAPFDALAAAVRDIIGQYDSRGEIDRSPIDALQPVEREAGSLAFPGKILADPTGERLFIADSGHDRILVATLDGNVQTIIGSGMSGHADGTFTTAAFQNPQGLAIDADRLFIADTGNGSVRMADLARETVVTIAGTGEQGMSMPDPGPSTDTVLRSPWDLALKDGKLYIAMAGTHQIWWLDLAEGTIAPYAGDGVEAIRDGDRTRAWLAQPSGLSIEGDRLYFADSETSAIRFVELSPGDQVQTLVGTGLFDFGDVDGVGDAARLQHPIGLLAHDGIVYVADSYNHKIKRLYPDERRVESWLGSGDFGCTDGDGESAQFDEPGGLALVGRTLFVADTNNHAVRCADLDTGTVTTLAIRLPE